MCDGWLSVPTLQQGCLDMSTHTSFLMPYKGKHSLLSTVVILVALTLTNGDYATEEKSLIAMLKANGSSEVRPANTTRVTSSLVLFALKSVDIGAEVMSLAGVMYNEWYDQRLAWDPTSNGIYKAVIQTKNVWVPPLVIENEVNKVGVLGSDGTPARVLFTGDVVWSPPISSTTSCAADITYYPYDRQTCLITVIGWSYTVDEVDVQVAGRPIDLTYYTNHGEWDILSTGYEVQHLNDGHNTFRKIKFKFVFRRKWPFYGQNIVLPIILNSVLMAMVFVVPIESGEKMGYCLTVLLSYIVLLTLVSDKLPSVSKQTSVIQMYLSIVLCIGTASTVCTIGVLRVHNYDEKKPVPGWLQKLARYILAPLLCRNCKSNRVASPDERSDNEFDHLPDAKHGSNERLYSCKEIAVMLDKFLFGTFAVILFLLTTGVLVALFVAYNRTS